MRNRLTRRRLIQYGVAAAAGLARPASAAPQSKGPRLETHTYKRVGDLDIKADVYRYGDDQVRPAMVWIHGGALINGHRAGVSGRVRKHAFDSGYVLVSIDYRLAPETKLPEIISDLEDAFAWLNRVGPERFGIDPKRIGVSGGSAGGYMTLTSGFRAKPRPKVLLSLWGYGDLVGDWYSKPSPHARHRSKMGREQAYQQVAGPPISDSRERKGNGGAFYQYCRQTGTWPTAVSNWDPNKEASKFDPYMAVKNVDANYPPTAMIHGTLDTDVPHQQSTMMAEQFKQHRVEYQLQSVPNGEHGLAGANPKHVNDAYRKAFAFFDKHLNA